MMWMRCDLGPGDRLAGIGDPGSADSGYRSSACAIKCEHFSGVTSHQPEVYEKRAGRNLPCLLTTLDKLYQVTWLCLLGPFFLLDSQCANGLCQEDSGNM